MKACSPSDETDAFFRSEPRDIRVKGGVKMRLRRSELHCSDTDGTPFPAYDVVEAQRQPGSLIPHPACPASLISHPITQRFDIRLMRIG
jgi:hypothetical protein